MQNLQKELIELLKAKPEYFANGKLIKNKVTEAADKYDVALLELLLTHSTIKQEFFIAVANNFVFKLKEFKQFLNNKSFLKESYTAFKNQIGLQDEEGNYVSENKDVVLAFPYKDCVLEGGQDKEEQKRNEIFYNETLAPDEITRLFDAKALSNFKLYDSKGEHALHADSEIDFTNQNLIIKGNNLLALHSLKKVKSIAEQVKLIYIDPPYNTGNDSFHYNDRFNHSTWLVFMKNRLEIARKLLATDGVIFVHLDYNMVHYCKILMDEIFGEENFINEIIWRRKQATSFGSSKFGITNDTILFYSKGSSYTFNPIYSLDDPNTQDYIKERFVYDDGDGRKYMKSPLVNSLYRPNLKYIFKGIEPPANGWLYSKEKMEEFFNNGELIIPKKSDARIYRRIYLDTYKGQVIQNIWTDIPIVNPMAKEQTDFNTQKPEKLLERIIYSCTNEEDLILDYHLGSGTTAAVAHKMKRKYIGIEQMDYLENITIERLKKVIGKETKAKQPELEKDTIINDYDTAGISQSVNWQGGGSFVYAELKRYNQQYIDEIKKAKDTKELLKLYEQMKQEAFFRIEVDHEKWNNETFEKLSLEEQKELLYECLDKNHLYVNLTEMEDAYYKMSKDDITLNKKFYNIS